MLSNAESNGNRDAQQNAAKAMYQSFLAEFPIELWGDELILGVSGGSDSVALAHLASTINRESGHRKKICLAHVNHQLRGDESDGDEEFVRNLAVELECDFHSWQVALSMGNQGEGQESRLRDLRYRLLGALARERSCRCIALAHHRDDQVETILFRIFRGTSLKGLQGIPASREIETGISVVRPLINTSRKQIHEYLANQGRSYRTDSSNLKDGPTRNWIRNELMPQLENRLGHSVSANISGLGKQVFAIQLMLDQFAIKLAEKCVLALNVDFLELNHDLVVNAETVILQQMLVQLWARQSWPQRDMNRQKWEGLARFMQQYPPSSGRMELPGNISATINSTGTIRLQSSNLD